MGAITTIQARRGTSAAWSASNPVLASGEIGFDTTLNDFKIGNGSTAWNSLSLYSSKAGADTLGQASHPMTDPAAVRPSGITSVWWLTATQPTNWVAGDIWVVTP